MLEEVLIVDRRDDGVALLTLNRPDQRNALSSALRQALIDTLGELAADDAVKAVVLTGAGATFCAGFDLKELFGADDQAAVFANANAYHAAVHTFAKPLIAAVEGNAVAGGMDLALMCDLRVGSETVRFGQPQVKMGVPAAYDLMVTVMAAPAARDLCLTGRIVEVDEAEAMGLIQRRCAGGEALACALELAAEIAAVQGSVTMKTAIVDTQPQLFEG